MNTTTQAPTEATNSQPVMQPSYHVERQQDATIVNVAMPGVPKDLVSIAFEKGVLSVKGVRRANRPDAWRTVRRELSDLDYALHLRLNGPIDDEKLTASYADAVLTITLPVRESAKPRLIAVN
jgi:HSP20 family protein